MEKPFAHGLADRMSAIGALPFYDLPAQGVPQGQKLCRSSLLRLRALRIKAQLEVAMKVFISSLISGMEAERAAAKDAIELFRHRSIMAEDFGARANSPQVACLNGLREADLVVLVLGNRYGALQASGLSATHEEYREARGNKPILVFLNADRPDPQQEALIQEVSGWEQGLFRAPFSDAADLGRRVAQAVHDYELTNAAAPLDSAVLAQRALQLLPEAERNQSGIFLHFALAAGPQATILRPAEMEARTLADAVEQQALFGRPPLLDRRLGMESGLEDHAFVVRQAGRYGLGANIRLWGTGDLRLVLPLRDDDHSGMPMVIEETVAEQLASAIAFAAWMLAHIDHTEKISHVALAARVAGRSAMSWRTRAEHAASPRSGSFDAIGREEEREVPVQLSPPHRVRAALTMNAVQLVEDFLVLLRRRWTDPGNRGGW